MKYLLIPLLVLASCGINRTESSSGERVLVRDESGVENGQPIKKRTVEREQTKAEASAATTPDLTPVPEAGGLAAAVGGFFGGPGGAALGGLAMALVGSFVGRKKAEGEHAETVSAIDAALNDPTVDPGAKARLKERLSSAHSASTKKTVRRLKP